MTLLPKSEDEFANKEYWNTFFRERGSKKFEWYGEYADLCGELHKYIKSQDSVLVVGCGNSMLSSDLYDVGYRHITNIDLSSVVIKQMKSKIGKERPQMVFEHMDALNMSYEKETFTVVLDKGTLDALMPGDSQDDKERACQLFAQVDKVLKCNGRYIIISLLQKHILKEILSFFTDKGWMIRIIRCRDVEKKNIEETGCLTMPVFMVVCVKFKTVDKIKSILEVNLFVDGKSERITSQEEVLIMVEGLQKTIMHCREAREEIEIKFCRKGENKPRYSIYVVDASRDQRQLLKYAAFIVPHGREVEWMFASGEGRSYLRESSGFDRLAVITLHRHQDYGSMNEVQDELRQTVLQLAPCFMAISSGTPNIPYLTLGDGVGVRNCIYSGSSDLSGQLVVEDVEIGHEIFRRLIFMNNQAVVQSEVKMKTVASKGKKNKWKKVVDSSYVPSSHILYMSIAVALKARESPSVSVAIVGLGGGGLCLFLNKVFPTIDVTGVELDPLVARLAKEYFGLETNERLKVVIKDGVEFLREKPKFDVIMFDVDSKERGSALSCPPPRFVESSVLEVVASILGDTGVFVTNVVSRVDAEHEELIRKIEKHFALSCWYNLKEDVNRIIFASNMRGVTKVQWNNQIRDASAFLDKTCVAKLKTKNGLLDLDHLTNQLQI